MFKKRSIIFTLIVLLVLAYGIYIITSAQFLIKNSLEKMSSLTSLYNTGSFSIFVNNKRLDYTYDYNSQIRNPNEALVSIKKSINNNKMNYKIFSDKNNKIYINNNNLWQLLKGDQLGYFLNPYTPFTMSEILKSLNLLSSIPYIKGETKINNKAVKIISVNLDTNKLSDLYKNLYKNRGQDSKVFKNFMSKLEPSGQYLLYIDPKTKYLHRLEITINTTIDQKKYTYRTNYSFYKFNSPVTMPKL